MKSILACVAVVILAIVGLGFWRGWFEVGGKQDDDKVHANLDVNVDKLKKDKDAFKKILGEKSSAMTDKLADLKHKAKDLTGEAKAKAEKEIEALSKRHETIQKKIEQIEESTEEKFMDLKSSLKGEIEEGAGGREEKNKT